ncbi:MAG: hypothetical protein R2861_06660 [Desulfobacterales bacterium]
MPDWPYDTGDTGRMDMRPRSSCMTRQILRRGPRHADLEPQPYATISLTPYLFDPISTSPGIAAILWAPWRLMMRMVFCIFELLADGDKSLVHVFKLESGGSGGSGSAGSDSGAGDDTGSGDDNVSDDDSTSSDDTGSGNDAGSGDDSGAGDDTTDEGAETSSGGGSGGGCFIRALSL